MMPEVRTLTAARQPCSVVLAQHLTGCQQCSQTLQATARRQAALQAPGVRVRCCRAERSTCVRSGGSECTSHCINVTLWLRQDRSRQQGYA